MRMFHLVVRLPRNTRQRKHLMHIYVVLATSGDAARSMIIEYFADNISRMYAKAVQVESVEEVENGITFVHSYLR